MIFLIEGPLGFRNRILALAPMLDGHTILYFGLVYYSCCQQLSMSIGFARNSGSSSHRDMRFHKVRLR